ncbi:hypothetical protein [Nonomuraea jiangxiensis]|uniref:Uncharacterized protein n=1 Tax=Nonomuraea jiangxiensis TaxID=633440 RepID=A0A1G8VE14_9ACTN|nr:hypothetical protein [Nonomuraea jiangxiensis]SDJ63575.1 hypothetical protein SAMN05421869_111273 [Nonomuraea jiangxiensis]
MYRRTATLGLAATLALTSCGTQRAGAPPAPAPRYEASVTVLEGHGHGPQLCAAVAESLPPRCGGPDVVGWDWKAVAHESQSGVRWGSYRVVGTWDGARLTLTEPPGAPERETPPGEDFSSPCPAPEGGWRPVDPARATQPALEQAIARAGTAKEFAGAWVDQDYLGERGADSPDANDPARLVLNLRFTGDLSDREAWIREVWGGALCVSGARRTEAELNSIQEQVQSGLGEAMITASSSVLRNQVEVGVWLVTEEQRRAADERYGAGAVVFDSVLRPVG